MLFSVAAVSALVATVSAGAVNYGYGYSNGTAAPAVYTTTTVVTVRIPSHMSSYPSMSDKDDRFVPRPIGFLFFEVASLS